MVFFLQNSGQKREEVKSAIAMCTPNIGAHCKKNPMRKKMTSWVKTRGKIAIGLSDFGRFSAGFCKIFCMVKNFAMSTKILQSAATDYNSTMKRKAKKHHKFE